MWFIFLQISDFLSDLSVLFKKQKKKNIQKKTTKLICVYNSMLLSCGKLPKLCLKITEK